MELLTNRWLGPALAFSLVAGGLYLLYTLGQPARVTVTWETGSERDTTGFNLWRSDPAAPITIPVRQVNREPIPARGNSLGGAKYEVVDSGVVPGEEYFYQIEEIDAAGKARRYPDTIAVRAGWPRAWVIAEAVAVIVVGVMLLALEWRRGRASTAVAVPVDAPMT